MPEVNHAIEVDEPDDEPKEMEDALSLGVTDEELGRLKGPANDDQL